MTRPAPTRLAAALALALVAGGTALLTPSAAVASPDKTNRGAVVDGGSYDRLIVHFDSGTSAAKDDGAAASEVAAVGRAAGHGLKVTRRLATGGALVQVDAKLDKAKTDRLIAKFVERSGVAYAEVDAVMTATATTPNDPSFAAQWHYSEDLAGMRLPTAWDAATGAGVTVAVLDTGITAHSDLDGNVIGGYDFVTSSTNARDGNGRDSNPLDQGDWYAAGECGQPTRSDSSWHGTHVAGTIAAVTGNGLGVAGVAYGAKVVPVRVLAKCGGTLADIADAITWASGGTVSGVPANPHPAKVINMSLGGSGVCGATYQNAINGAVGRGTTVVVAAGNSNANAAGYQPASCGNTVVVAATNRSGARAYYSNYGAVVDVAAPGGDTPSGIANGVLSTLNSGTTVPVAESYAYYQGTSMATPHVAGLAALLLQGRNFGAAEVETWLKNGTRPLPGACSGGCGAGLVDATATVAAADTPLPPPPPAPASRFTNDAEFPIPDGGTVDSSVTVVGRAGNAPSALKVEVAIVHPRRGDLQIDLVAPDGSLYRLLSSRKNDTAPYVATTYTVNASAEAANGTWKLRVRDTRTGNTGTIDSWSLQF